MSRCRACNRPLEIGTSLSKNPLTGEPEDLCFVCREKSRSEYNYMYDHDHITPVGSDSKEKKSSYFYEFFDNSFM